MSKVIGIDLGTSNSCVAYIKDGKPVVIADEEGKKTTPSVFAISGAEEPLVGHAAKRQQTMNRMNTIFAVKRLIGRKFESEEVQEAIRKLPYTITAAENGDAWVKVNGNPMSPEEVSAHVLTRMKLAAEAHFGESVHRAVITVPAHFNDSQRQATKDAGRIAGLDVMRIINEPTAAALAYGLDVVDSAAQRAKAAGNAWQASSMADRVIAVFDLGGGTFDISILELREGIFDVLATNGDTYLGGEDFDMSIVNYLLEEFQKKAGVDLSTDKNALEKLKSAAKDAKHALTDQVRTEIELPFVQGLEHLKLTMERKDLEKIVEPSLKRLENPCLMALDDAELEPSDVTDVVLVGGMTRMPAVKKYCQQIFGVAPLDTIDPDEAVALGAAAQAGLLQGFVKGVSLLDVTSLSLGIETQGGKMHTIIPRNTTVPVKVTEIFSTSAPNQPQVSFHVVQGESDFAPDNKTLARFELTGIRPAHRGEPDIAVTFEVDGEGIVHVSAKDLGTEQEHAMEIFASSGLEDGEIDRLLRDRRMIEEQKERTRSREQGLKMEEESDSEVGKKRTSLKSVVFTTQFKLDQQGQGFKGKSRKLLEESLVIARDILEEGIDDLEEIEEVLGELSARAAKLDDYIDMSWQN